MSDTFAGQFEGYALQVLLHYWNAEGIEKAELLSPGCIGRIMEVGR